MADIPEWNSTKPEWGQFRRLVWEVIQLLHEEGLHTEAVIFGVKLREELLKELRAREQCCEVCWTNSFEPCEENHPGAQQYKDGTGYVVCAYCQLVNHLIELKKKIEILDALHWQDGCPADGFRYRQLWKELAHQVGIKRSS